MSDPRRPSLHTRLLRVAAFVLTNIVLITWLYELHR
jgi:hypothetical protein